MGLILDTSVLIAAERDKFDLEALFLDLKSEAVFMASITLSELWHGCHRGKGPMVDERLKHVRYLESKLPVLEFGVNEALVHAKNLDAAHYFTAATSASSVNTFAPR
jgi:tRNA(fMet)-specific endonuclease VapC